MNAIDMIFDENNSEPIVMYSEKGDEMKFDQIALIPLDGVAYVILKPLTPYVGGEELAEDEALVFAVTEVGNEDCLEIVEDDAIIDRVFADYYKLLAEEGIDVPE